MTSYQPERVRGPLGWLAVSALFWLLGISCWTLAGLPPVMASRWWAFIVGGIPVFQGFAAWSPRSVEEVLVSRAEAEQSLARLLPYAPMAIAIAVLAGGLFWWPLSLTREVLAIFLVMVVLLLFRQVQAIEDLQTARRSLEDRVRQRTKALEQAQDTLLRTERMNTAALMGAGLAHDLNNLLCAMKSTAELAAMNLEEGRPPTLRELTRIAKTADDAALLTRGLMGYVRREAQDRAPMDLGRELKEMDPTLRLLLPRSVQLHLDAPEGVALWVSSSKLQLEQMLVNLVANAVDAMPGGGRLTVRVRQGQAEPDSVVIEVQDSGSGMGPETLERIFEPFFTTKPPGRGTGLGLPSLKAMIEEGGGRMEVESQLGQGSRFRIVLPRVAPEGLSPR
jgi:signal transduction histidine kinase